MALRAIHLCSGYGGFELALAYAGIPTRTACHVEWDAYAAATLVARMEDQDLDPAPVWDDLATFDGGAWSGKVDIITAGFPCQPFSPAGKQRHLEDDRWIWGDVARVIREVGPGWVAVENVPGIHKRGLGVVLEDLATLGFDAEWGMFSAAAVGASHVRERFWLWAWRNDLVADPHGPGLERQDEHDKELPVIARRGGHTFPPLPGNLEGWTRWVRNGGPEPTVRRGPDGRHPWLADALHLGGNGLVPQCGGEAIRKLIARGMGGTGA